MKTIITYLNKINTLSERCFFYALIPHSCTTISLSYHLKICFDNQMINFRRLHAEKNLFQILVKFAIRNSCKTRISPWFQVHLKFQIQSSILSSTLCRLVNYTTCMKEIAPIFFSFRINRMRMLIWNNLKII